ncbi:MAG: DUF2130 domain-containing protein [Patescibacteria group bacterium]
MNTTIKCKKCGFEIEVSEALAHQTEERILVSIQSRHLQELEDARKQAAETAESKAKEQLSKDLKDKDEQINNLKGRAQKAEDAELAIRKEKRELDEARRSFELEKQRQMDEEREKIRLKATEEQIEKDKLKFAEYEKQKADLAKALEDANRKANQGSQQLQGEVQELDLEETLRRLFPTDGVEEIKKGELGGDIRHTIKTARGTICGKIIWESKRTKAWSDSWISKLKGDVQRDKAHIGVIVSEALPIDFKKEIGEKGGVWIVSPKLIEPLGALLRKNLYDVAKEKATVTLKQSTAEEMYDFVTSHEFAQQVERMAETYLEMKGQISKERASAERSWKLREIQVDRLLLGVSGIYGSMTGIAGQALPQIKLLQSGEPEEPDQV